MKTASVSKPAIRIACLGLSALAASTVHATDGYFDYGYGVQAKGIGGAGVAFPQDGLAPASNPAGAAFLDNRLDAGLTYLNPNRTATSTANGVTYSGNGIENFYIPEIGFKHSINTNWDFALAIYGNGGMNTDYAGGLPGYAPDQHVGVDLEQLFVAPTLAYKITPNHAFGISPLFALQRFRAYGLQGFGVPDAGYDYSYGTGVRVGYTGRLTDWLTVGATYQSRTFTTKFHKYDNLFAEQGSFDIPSNYAVGLALKPQKQLTWAVDVERIQYSEVRSVGNLLTFSAPPGADNGPGFGWRDVTVVKTGLAYDVIDSLTLRAGYNYTTQPIRPDQTYFNVLAPAVPQHHVTAGLTWRFEKDFELSAFYAHAFENEVKGSGSIAGPETNYNLSMSQNTFGVSLSWLL